MRPLQVVAIAAATCFVVWGLALTALWTSEALGYPMNGLLLYLASAALIGGVAYVASRR